MAYQFINAKLDGVLRTYVLGGLEEPPDYMVWIDEITQEGFKISMRFNPDFGGFSVTISDARGDKDKMVGFSSWGGSLDACLFEAYAKLDVLLERGSFLDLPKIIKDLEKALVAEVEDIRQKGLSKLVIRDT